ncbi:unnamed protein product [Gongylonema pulchrum]|uniref:RCK N-terminal domain-containing protein n=1 Tax=Gongylonema pulchrum TaxID=637853 RepID=A0A183E9T5_9BILA|nr:unnamed protein product [Gongylonema pulchrum]
MSRLFVVVLICIAFAILPKQIEALGQTYVERQKAGGEYNESWASNEKHVVVTVTHLEAEFIQDFLSEFYAHPEHQNYLVILLSPCEMDDRMRMLLKIPMWSNRVLYIRGSALIDGDLERARMTSAKACFILSARHINQKTRTANFISNFINNNSITSNEIYDIQIADSKFFGEYIGKSFIYASFHAHKKYGVGLIGIKSQGLREKILLNPGHYYYLKPTDTAYYIALTNEESLYDFHKGMNAQRRKANLATAIANIGAVAIELPQADNEHSKLKKKRRFLHLKRGESDGATQLLVCTSFSHIIFIFKKHISPHSHYSNS